MPAKLIGVERYPCGEGFRATNGACLAESSCEAPGENSKCWRDRPNGATVPWEGNEGSCWSYPDVTATAFHFGNRKIVSFGDAGMLCGTGYPDDPDDAKRGCSDAYGRRVKWNGYDWFEVDIEGRQFSGWWHGYCPPLAMKLVEAPTTAVCRRLPECGGPDLTHNPAGRRVYGCCDESEIGQVFRQKVEDAQAVLERTRPDLVKEGRVLVDDAAYTEALAEVLSSQFGVCARSGGPEDEVGVKTEDGWSEQYDVITSQHLVWANQTVTCRPARF